MPDGDGSAAAVGGAAGAWTGGAWTGSIVKSARVGVIAVRKQMDIRTARMDDLRVFDGVCRSLARTGCEKCRDYRLVEWIGEIGPAVNPEFT